MKSSGASGLARVRKRHRSSVSEPLGVLKVESSLAHLLQQSSGTVDDALQSIKVKEPMADGGHQALYEGLLALGAQLQQFGNRLARQHAAELNMGAWPFTQDLGVKIFSHMSAHDCTQAAAACTLFARTAADPACYQVLDLVPRGLHVTLPALTMLVARAGRFLRILRLGVLPKPPSPAVQCTPHRCGRRRSSVASRETPAAIDPPERPAWVPQYVDNTLPLSRLMQGKEKGRLSPLGKQCLQVLGPANGNAGAGLLRLHLYNLVDLDARALTAAIALCPRLQDLEVVGLQVAPASILDAVAEHCPLLERFCCQPRKRTGLYDVWADQDASARRLVLRTSMCERFAECCPALSSFTLRSCILQDRKVAVLLKKLPLQYLDLCGAQYLTGTFLKELPSLRDCRLQHLLLRDCMRLREDCVESFLHALLLDECPSLRSLDVSNKNGLASGWEWFARQKSGRVADAVARLPQQRPNCWLTADFPDVSESGTEEDSDDSSDDSEDSLASQLVSEEDDSEEDENEEDDEDDDEDDDDDDDDDEIVEDDDSEEDDDEDDEDGPDNDGDEVEARGRQDLARARDLLHAAQERLRSVDQKGFRGEV